MAYQLKPYDVAGFHVFGRRLDDGRIQLGSREQVDAFPEEVEFCGVVYTLEEIEDNEINDELRARLSPDSIAEAERICWGIYV